MEFSIPEWNAIKRYLDVALECTLDSEASLEAEKHKDIAWYTDMATLKKELAEIAYFIACIEAALI